MQDVFSDINSSSSLQMKAVFWNSIPVSMLALAITALPLSAASMKTPGVPNFNQVNDQVYRGGQPTDEGWNSLMKLGIKTVIDLRREGEDGEHSIEAEARAVRAAGMRFVSIPMRGAPAGPTHEEIANILEVLDSQEPVFVHCKKGKDRTGTAIACYRIAHDRWDNKKALEEAKTLGIHWYEIGMRAYIQSFDPASAAVARAPKQTAAAAAASGGAQ
jgi:uncharacterized protein (TIGR01244 family)